MELKDLRTSHWDYRYLCHHYLEFTAVSFRRARYRWVALGCYKVFSYKSRKSLFVIPNMASSFSCQMPPYRTLWSPLRAENLEYGLRRNSCPTGKHDPLTLNHSPTEQSPFIYSFSSSSITAQLIKIKVSLIIMDACVACKVNQIHKILRRETHSSSWLIVRPGCELIF